MKQDTKYPILYYKLFTHTKGSRSRIQNRAVTNWQALYIAVKGVCKKMLRDRCLNKGNIPIQNFGAFGFLKYAEELEMAFAYLACWCPFAEIKYF